jgi:two-component system, LytTR family, sensor kinase
LGRVHVRATEETRSPGAAGRRSRRVIWFLLIFALYAVIAVVFATERMLGYRGGPNAVGWWASFRTSAAPWTAWLLLTPLIVHLTRRFPVDGGRWKRSLLVHAGAMTAVAPVQAVLNIYIGAAISILFDGYHPTWTELLDLPPAVVLTYSVRNPLIYAMVVAVTSTMDYYRKYRDRETETARLEGQLATARLQALQSQIHPHFLFNTLNAVTALIRRDAEAAERMLVRLADLLRMTLDGGDSQEIPLRREMELLEAYLAIEKVRFSDRLRVVEEVAPDVLEERIPRLLLQPLVENAIRHGLEPKRGGGTLTISARRRGETLELAVRDDGVGSGGEATAGAGLGLRNTRARLKALCGETASLELETLPEGGTAAIIRLPARVRESDHAVMS